MIAVRLKPAPRGRQRVDANGKLTLRPESVTDRSSRPSSRLSDTLQPRGDIDAGSRQVAVGLSPTLPKWMPTRNSIHLSGATPGRLAIDWICLLINRQPPHALLACGGWRFVSADPVFRCCGREWRTVSHGARTLDLPVNGRGSYSRALSHCEIKTVVRLPSRRFQAAATASRHVVIAAARRTRCV